MSNSNKWNKRVYLLCCNQQLYLPWSNTIFAVMIGPSTSAEVQWPAGDRGKRMQRSKDYKHTFIHYSYNSPPALSSHPRDALGQTEQGRWSGDARLQLERSAIDKDCKVLAVETAQLPVNKRTDQDGIYIAGQVARRCENGD